MTLRETDADYALLCRDVTQPRDLAILTGILSASERFAPTLDAEVQDAAAVIRRNRPAGQIAAIAAQLRDLLRLAQQEGWQFQADRPAAIGVAGGRLRIAFMHPDMGRFCGPAWQMPMGAADADGREQILILTQDSDDDALHLHPTETVYRERLDSLPSDDACMYPGEDVNDCYSYEGFGTRMAEHLLMALGYFSDSEIQARRNAGLPLPPPSLWVANGMRRPFSLIGNAIASIRTLRSGLLGARVQTYLGRHGFRGLRVASSGNIPRGGFSSSSAVTIAVKNAVNALFQLDIPPDQLIRLACQAEYGTGVRAGTLDQATAQKGTPGTGALISSNPREQYRVLGVFPVPSDRFRILFPYSVDRDREAWRWSAGMYAETAGDPVPTGAEIRKMTGKAAEIAAWLLRLPPHRDFFPEIQEDLMRTGMLGPDARRRVASVLLALPIRVSRATLRARLKRRQAWFIQQHERSFSSGADAARQQFESGLNALLEGWRDPRLQRATPDGAVRTETGMPLRAMMAYLYGEVAKNFYLVHHPESWIACVAHSQTGDRCFDIDPERLPAPEKLERETEWEKNLGGPERMNAWLRRIGARPVDFNRGLEDRALQDPDAIAFHHLSGGNFFRGLALIDLAEALLKRAFGADAVAVRVNAAGQGDYFQVHIDTHKADPEAVRSFLRTAFYRRFGLKPNPEFVQPHPGGGAVGVRLSRFDRLPRLVETLGEGHD